MLKSMNVGKSLFGVHFMSKYAVPKISTDSNVSDNKIDVRRYIIMFRIGILFSCFKRFALEEEKPRELYLLY